MTLRIQMACPVCGKIILREWDESYAPVPRRITCHECGTSVKVKSEVVGSLTDRIGVGEDNGKEEETK